MLNELRQAGHFIDLAGSLRIKHASPRRPLHSIKPNSNKLSHNDSVSLRLIVPPSYTTQVIQCETTDELKAIHQKFYKRLLVVSGKDGLTKSIPFSKYSEVSPSTVYEIESPFLPSLDGELRHTQITDKAFKDKS